MGKSESDRKENMLKHLRLLTWDGSHFKFHLNKGHFGKFSSTRGADPKADLIKTMYLHPCLEGRTSLFNLDWQNELIIGRMNI